jgi:hypothetical protein
MQANPKKWTLKKCTTFNSLNGIGSATNSYYSACQAVHCFLGIQRSITMLDPNLSQLNTVHTFIYYFSKIHFNVILTSIELSEKSHEVLLLTYRFYITNLNYYK